MLKIAPPETMTGFPVFLINLDSSEKRLETSRTQFEMAGVLFDRVSAVDGRNRTPRDFPNYDEQATQSYYGRGMTCGEIACYLSHVKALRRFVETGQDIGLILEDDFLLSPKDWETLRALEAEIRAGHIIDWDLINLFKPPKKIKQDLMRLNSGRNTTLYRAFYFPTGAVATMWSRAGAESFLTFASDPLCPIDHHYRKWVSETGRGLGLDPTPFASTNLGSDISDASPGWVKPAPISRYRMKEIRRQSRCLILAQKNRLLRLRSINDMNYSSR